MVLAVYVLDCGDLFASLFNLLALFSKSSSFTKLIGIAASFGLFMAIIRYFKTSNPLTIGKWFMTYMLILNIAIIPKCDVQVFDISTQKTYAIANVPLAVAFLSHSLTTLGYGLAQLFDSIFSTPDSIQYSKTGFLFGSRLIQESREFRITDPLLRTEFSMYFKRCVVGNIYLNRVLSPTDLRESNSIWQSISKNPSTIRRTLIINADGTRENKTCFEATPILREKLNKEINSAYKIFGIKIFGKPRNINYEQLFNTHLSSAFGYYQAIDTNGSNVFLQSMMLNVIKDGVTDYEKYLNSTASIMGHEFSKAQIQQQYLWQIAGMKSAWLWPFFHSVVLYLVIALFPIIILLAIAYNVDGLKDYLLLFLSLQLWPVLFAILNYVMSLYGSSVSSKYGAINLANLDNIEQLHMSVAAVAGGIMLFIPWFCKGAVTKIGDAFSSLSQSMISSVQSSNMAAASEASNASFSLGQTSFYNATGNTLSANKHDTNFTSMEGSATRMLDSGVTLTTTPDGEEIVDATGSISKGAFHLDANQTVNGMLNNAAETNIQSISSQSKQLSSVVSEGFGHLTQFSSMESKDLRLGDGVSESDNTQVQQAVSNILGMASNVASRTGVSTEQALTGLINAGVTTQVGVSSDKSLLGKFMGLAVGADGSVYARGGYDKSDSTSHRSHDGFDKVLDAKQMEDFKHDLSYVQHFGETHNLDTAHSKGASLLSQATADLREAQQISNNLDASLSKGTRIATAQSVTESGGAAVHQNLDQMFQKFVTDKVGKSERNYLYGHPGTEGAQAELLSLANDFIKDEGISDKIIDTYGNQLQKVNPKEDFESNRQVMQHSEKALRNKYLGNKDEITTDAYAHDVVFDNQRAQDLQNKVESTLNEQNRSLKFAKNDMQDKTKVLAQETDRNILKGRHKSHMSSIIEKEEA